MSYNFAEKEKEIMKFWENNRIFEKLRQKNKKGRPWSFLDGPITANNPMGVHHAWGRTYKDLLQRYFAMKGFDERYQNGFDCQGLWVEVEVEKELGFKTKKDIEAYGIDKFVEKCKERVRKYSAMQTQQSIRLGQWMDWENSYYTMSDENNYAIWHFLKKCWEKGYLYKGRDSVPWCPRCGTAISQHEILTEEYKEIVHDSIYFRLPIIGSPSASSRQEARIASKGAAGQRKNEYLLVWTTTPWTLIANIAVAVDKKLDYALVAAPPEKAGEPRPGLPGREDKSGAKYWVAKDLAEKIFKEGYKIVKTAKGKELVGLKYVFAFDDLPRVKETANKFPKSFHKVFATDDRIMPINIEEGTGLVHTAVSAGQEDFRLGKKLGLPLIEVIDEEANYLDGLGEFSGKNAKKNPKIILDYLLTQKNFVFKIEPYKHRYPTCWRCKTELVWRVVDEWYISMDKLRKPLENIVKKINWIPEFGKERELDWLKNMHDWLISKKRYWGLALPIFECQECGNFEVIGSKEELKKRAVEGWEKFAASGEPRPDRREGNSPHRPWVDNVKIECRGVVRDPDSGRDKKCKKIVSRIKDVGSPWLDAGIVPFSTIKYFSDKKYWKKWFPAEIIAESFPGQFKNWFYSLLVMSAVLEDAAPMKTIFGYASVRDEKGEEMHKSKGNTIWFDDAVEKIGADVMRWFYMRHNPAENLNFGYKTADEIKRKLLVLHNVYLFFETYVDKKDFPILSKPENLKIKPVNPSSRAQLTAGQSILDKWIVSKLEHLVSLIEFNLEKYDVAKTVLAIEDFFINDLSLWYLRRSRKRFHSLSDGLDQDDRKKAIETLYCVLLNTAKIISPIMPFFAERMYRNLKSESMAESVHLQDWPQIKNQTDLDLESKMDEARQIVNLALGERSANAIKVRQPLAKLKINSQKFKVLEEELLDLIKDEVNVKEVVFDDKIKKEVELDINITKELKEEGVIRESIRIGNDLRKEAHYMPLMYITGITSTATVFSNPKVLEILKVEKGNFKKIDNEKDIPEDWIKKEIRIENEKVDFVAIPKIKK